MRYSGVTKYRMKICVKVTYSKSQSNIDEVI